MLETMRQNAFLALNRFWHGWLGLLPALLMCQFVGVAAASPEVPPTPQLRLQSTSHTAGIRRLAVDEVRRIVVTASDDRTARIWDLDDGSLRHVLRPPTSSGSGQMYGAALHPTRPLVAIGGATGANGSIYLFDTESGRMLRRIDARGGDVRRLEWSTDGTVLLAVYAGQHAFRAFAPEGRLLFDQSLLAASYGLATSSNGLAAVASLNGQIDLYRAAAGSVQPIRSIRTTVKDAVSVSFSPDGSSVAVGYNQPGASPQVFIVASGKVAFDLTDRRSNPVQYDEGALLAVAWSRDGRFINATGRAWKSPGKILLYRFDSVHGREIGEAIVASDTVQDMVALTDGRLLFGSLDGSWGIVSEGQDLNILGRRQTDYVRTATGLEMSGNGRRLRWYTGGERAAIGFDFKRRVVEAASEVPLRPTVVRRSVLDFSNTWENTANPVVSGRRIDMDPTELARTLSFLPGEGGAVLGTSRALYRIASDGAVAWRRDADVEIRALNVTEDGRFVVGALNDGTIRWWRARDGEHLLTLFATLDGQWVVWTPTGFYDASAGADRLVGWSVDRGQDSASDFFTLNRFRDRYNRPDVIDKVFQTADVQQAVVDAQTFAAAVQEPVPEPDATTPSDSPLAIAAPHSGGTPMLPPMLYALESEKVRAENGIVALPFAIRSPTSLSDLVIEVRINGRPSEIDSIKLPERADGNSPGIVGLTVHEPQALVQVIAHSQGGVSEPLNYNVERWSPAGLPPLAATVASAPPIDPMRPVLYVLAVGISEYQRKEYRLGLPAKDARDFANAIQGQQRLLYKDVVVRSLTDAQATRSAVLEQLHWLSSTASRNDVVMLFLAGHGFNEPGGQYYFLPYDGKHDQLRTTGVPESAIRETLGRVKGRAIFFVDTCFSGNVVGNYRNAGRELSRLANDLAAAENGVIVFASSTGRQESEENDEWGNGAFTKALIAGLGGKADLARTGRITYKGLDFFVSEEVRRLTSGRQTPVTISPIGIPDFAVARLTI